MQSEQPEIGRARAVMPDTLETHDGRGACLWLTGRSGAGKSTLVQALLPKLEASGRTVTVLDVVPELRKLRCERSSRGKLIRKAFVAREVVRHGGLAVCVTISANRDVREEARALVGDEAFLEIYLEAPAAVSEMRRDTRPTRPSAIKRIRRRAKQALRRVLGRSGGFDVPDAPALTIDTVATTPEQGAGAVIELLEARGVIVRRPE
jgi:sulfate adenylyltransferase